MFAKCRERNLTIEGSSYSKIPKADRPTMTRCTGRRIIVNFFYSFFFCYKNVLCLYLCI